MDAEQRAELEKWKEELVAQINELEKKLDDLRKEVHALSIRKDVVQRVVMRYSDSKSIDEFKEEFYNPIKEQYEDKYKKLAQLEEETTTRKNFLNAILSEIMMLLKS